jgi:RNA polymerase sigma factor for flagellar operon FliA
VNAPLAPDLPVYEGIRVADVCLVESAADAQRALADLMAGDAIGFDTESKPTFNKGELSTGPHLVQLASDDKAWLFPVTGNPALDVLREILESPRLLKVGFGLRDDLRRLRGKLGIDAVQVLDLAIVLREGKRGDVGAKTAVARFFGQRLHKSKKTSTTNWANPRLSERQILYAANDAHVALKIYRAWKSSGGRASAAAGQLDEGAARGVGNELD